MLWVEGGGPDSDESGHLVGKRKPGGDDDKRTDSMISVPLEPRDFYTVFYVPGFVLGSPSL